MTDTTSRVNGLSRRETEVLRLLALGCRNRAIAREFGHVAGLAHEPWDYDCALSSPLSIMDYDCLPIGVQPWDSCGINHAYYDPNWGWSGC